MLKESFLKSFSKSENYGIQTTPFCYNVEKKIKEK